MPHLMGVALYNRQRAVALPVERLVAMANLAALECLEHPGKAASVLETLECVEISLVSDRVIARVHRRFLNEPGATDVITFPHGEIVISATTAARQALENHEEVGREVARYIVHGFLHLHGHEDGERNAANIMWQAQEEVLAALWPAPRQRRSS